MIEDNVCPCEECGCLGNCECGCEPVDKEVGCGLNQLLECGCCAAIGKNKNMLRWSYNPLQIEMDL